MATLEETVSSLVTATNELIQNLETKIDEWSTEVDAAIAQITAAAQAGTESVSFPDAVFEAAVVNTDVVYWNSGTSEFTKAVANSAATSNVAGIADVANTRLYLFGESPDGLFSGLTPGSRYYLDPTTPGAITTVRPATFAVFIGIALSATKMFIDIDALPDRIGPSELIKGTLAYGATVTPNFNEYVNYDLTATGDFILAFPTLVTDQTSGRMTIDITASGSDAIITLAAGLVDQGISSLTVLNGATHRFVITLYSGTVAQVSSEVLALA